MPGNVTMEGNWNQAPGPGAPAVAAASAHLVGVCGSGMKALAELLVGFGWRLSGSDMSPASPSILALRERGLQFFQGHSGANVPADTQYLVYSPAIPLDNPERIAAAARGIAQRSYGQMLGELMASRVGICIAGTHGKSTTTAMVGWILGVAGLDPTIAVGADLCNGGSSGRAGSGELMVVESCEFNYSFFDFQPRHAAILNIEPDHFDCYADLPALVQSFHGFARRVPVEGVLLVNGDCPSALCATAGLTSRRVTFGLRSKSDWSAARIVKAPQGLQFDVVHRGRDWGRIRLRLPGEHNVQNALAAAALCAEIGVPAVDIAAGLKSFAGIRRRFEVVGERNGIVRIDDYAHHPTAVRATLQTAREVYGSRRIWCVFQPHQVSRTVRLMEEFAGSFDAADEVLVAPAFAAREHVVQEPVLVSLELAERIAARGRAARFVESLDQIQSTVDDAARPGDVVIAMGAGDIDRIHHEFTRPIR